MIVRSKSLAVAALAATLALAGCKSDYEGTKSASSTVPSADAGGAYAYQDFIAEDFRDRDVAQGKAGTGRFLDQGPHEPARRKAKSTEVVLKESKRAPKSTSRSLFEQRFA